MNGIEFNITLIIMVITALISYKAFNDQAFFNQLKHFPYAEKRNKEWYRMLTSGFLHGGWAHLIINMYVLLEFGGLVERFFVNSVGELWGRLLFVIMYITTIIAADIPTYLKHKDNPSFASIGASGAVSGIVFIFILLYPMSGMGILFIPIRFPAIVFGILYLVYSSWASRNQRGIIDHDAHFYGAIWGMLFVIAMDWEVFPRFIAQIANAF